MNLADEFQQEEDSTCIRFERCLVRIKERMCCCKPKDESRADDYSKKEDDANNELFEVEFNYIHIGRIQTNDKTQLIKTLCESDDLELFEQEAIQVIIDYKWNTYARSIFLMKLVIYLVFEVFFFADVENL